MGTRQQNAREDRETFAPLPPLHCSLGQHAQDVGDYGGRAGIQDSSWIQRPLAQLFGQGDHKFRRSIARGRLRGHSFWAAAAVVSRTSVMDLTR